MQETSDNVNEKSKFVRLKKSILNIVKLKLYGSRMITKVEKTLDICDKYEGPEEARKCFDYFYNILSTLKGAAFTISSTRGNLNPSKTPGGKSCAKALSSDSCGQRTAGLA